MALMPYAQFPRWLSGNILQRYVLDRLDIVAPSGQELALVRQHRRAIAGETA